MKTPELRIHGRVTTATATSVVITAGVDTMDAKAAGTTTTVTLTGTGYTGYAVGDPIRIQVNG